MTPKELRLLIKASKTTETVCSTLQKGTIERACPCGSGIFYIDWEHNTAGCNICSFQYRDHCEKSKGVYD